MESSQHLIVAKKADTRPTAPSHVRGVPQGNRPPKHLLAQSGIEFFDLWAFATPRRSTGVSADDRMPVHPDSPVLTPP